MLNLYVGVDLCMCSTGLFMFRDYNKHVYDSVKGEGMAVSTPLPRMKEQNRIIRTILTKLKTMAKLITSDTLIDEYKVVIGVEVPLPTPTKNNSDWGHRNELKGGLCYALSDFSLLGSQVEVIPNLPLEAKQAVGLNNRNDKKDITNIVAKIFNWQALHQIKPQRVRWDIADAAANALCAQSAYYYNKKINFALDNKK